MNKNLMDRKPVAAGRFYTNDKIELHKEIENLFSESDKLTKAEIDAKDILALIAPHAGYVFSGTVAASAFSLVQDIKPRKKIFLIGSSHYTHLNGASVYNVGDYITPLGKVKVDKEIVNKLIENSGYFNYSPHAHEQEHCLEVLLPFLQYIWKDEFEIIPIIIGTHDTGTIQEIAKTLAPWFCAENLFVFSTDLSHYPSYKDANRVDKLTCEAIVSGNPDVFLKQIDENEKMNISGLSTSICGWTSVLALQYITQQKKNMVYHPVLYQNSGDAKLYGDHDRVVGYQSIAITQSMNNNDFKLTEEDKATLLQVARDSIETYLETGKRITPNPDNYSENLKAYAGAFVSVYIGNELNGCIGHIEVKDTPLVNTVAEMAVSSGFYDSRFAQLTAEGLKELKIEISVLTPLKKIDSINEIELGKHGILIRSDYRSGTYLPQVADKTNWTKEEFLGHCSKDKAGIGWDGWKNADIYTYEAIVFKSSN